MKENFLTVVKDNTGPVTLCRHGHGGTTRAQIYGGQSISHFSGVVPAVFFVAKPQLTLVVFSETLLFFVLMGDRGVGGG